MDRFALDRRALAWSCEIVAEVTPADLQNPTPCGNWTLSELLGHMTAHNRGFAAGLRGAPVGGEVWDSLELPDDFQTAYRAAADDLNDAFAAPELPETIDVFGYGDKLIPIVLGMHIIDFAVHGWDVARSIGSPRVPDDELADAAYQLMLGFPGKRPSKAFGLIVPVPDEAPISDQLMGHVGRDPQWKAPNPS